MVDRIVTLFESTDTDFSTNGIGPLPDAVSCEVTEEKNSIYELEMEYPVDGIRFSELVERRFVFTKPNPYADPQPFRIYGMSKPINGIVTVKAAHISYDLRDITCSPFSAGSVTEAFVNMNYAADIAHPFTFWTDKSTVANMKTMVPISMRTILGGMEGSILDVYRGEYEFDGYTVKLWNNRGADRGVSIRYGKNLTNLRQERNCDNVYTAIRPYWYKEPDDYGNGGLVELTEKILHVDGEFDYIRIMPLDLSDAFDAAPTEDELRAYAQEWLNNNDISVPEVSLDVSFVNLSDSEEYKNLSLLETVKLCDTVNVEFPKLGVSAKATVVKTVYDALAGRYIKIELGSNQASLSHTISVHNKELKQATTKTDLETAVSTATTLITGHAGGYVVLNPAEQPQEVLILDTPDLYTAVKVWRWNSSGLGYSNNGYEGPYETAITMNGEIVADFIKTGIISANLIKGGVLALGSNENQNGVLQVYDESNTLIAQLDQHGLTLYGTDGFHLNINPEDGFAGYDRLNNKLFWVNEDEFHQKKSVIEEEITLCDKIRFIPITLTDNNTIVNDGIAVVSVVG